MIRSLTGILIAWSPMFALFINFFGATLDFLAIFGIFGLLITIPIGYIIAFNGGSALLFCSSVFFLGFLVMFLPTILSNINRVYSLHDAGVVMAWGLFITLPAGILILIVGGLLIFLTVALQKQNKTSNENS